MNIRKIIPVVCSGLLSSAVHADGKWYTDYTQWLLDVGTVSSTAEFNNLPGGALYNANGAITSLSENGVTVICEDINANALWGVMASHDGSNFHNGVATGQISTTHQSPLSFSFAGDSFGGRFLATNTPDIPYFGEKSVPIYFTTSNGDKFTLQTLAGDAPYSFVGYISDSAEPITVTLTSDFNDNYQFGNYTDFGDQNDSLIYVAADSFSFRSNNPGNNAVPEPSEWAAMGLFGAGLLGLVVRGRKKKLAN
jgi:hypothetical protein